MPPFIIALPVLNVATLSQANSQWGANIALGAAGPQTLAQVASNTAAITQR